jgi:hypothetical protein
MEKMWRIVILMIAMIALTSCVPDPRREASAYATRLKADSSAATKAQALQQDAAANDLWMSRLVEVSQWINTMIMTSLIAASFTVFVALTSFGVGSSFVFIGAGVAHVKRNLAQPNQVKLDPVTRQFPLLIVKIKDGQYSLSNPNTDSVTMLYDRNPADRMMIQAMSATQHDGALAYQARLSHRPGEIATIQSQQIIEMRNE